MNVAHHQEPADEHIAPAEERVSGIRTRMRSPGASESDHTRASMLRVWLQYNTRAPRYVRAALEHEIDRLQAAG